MKKYHFNVFRHEKHFEKLPQPHSQTGLKTFKKPDGGNGITVKQLG